ncbi:CAP domain-containing protein [Pseudarthrobacter sp. Fe7]|nr:CAP domain-containing protein [Pseudarthrobacter sp. Fe7]
MSALTLGVLLALPCGVVAATSSNAAQVPAIVPAVTIADSFTKQTFDLINAERTKVGSKPFIWNQKIADVSQDWANHLGAATMDPTFDFGTIHRTDAGGNEIPAGSTWYRENIGFNFSPAQLVDWWMNSPGHKAAMLDPRGTDAGIGYVVPTSGPYAGWHLMVSNMAAYPTTSGPTAPAPSPSTAAPQSPLALKAAAVNGALGLSVSPEVYGLKDGGSYRNYQYGALIYSPATGAHISVGSIRNLWAGYGFENGILGYPATDEVAGLKGGGAYQNYQGGAILWSPASGAHISTGSIRDTWAATGFENGMLGYPTSEIYPVEGGTAQTYQGGVITHSASAGNQIVSGEMLARYQENSGYLGVAVSAKTAIRDGGFYQNFQRGALLYSPATGTQLSIGGVRSIWAATGFENGVLGYPSSGEIPANGGVYQTYQGGFITWLPDSGGHFVFGGIGSLYRSAGGPTGRLGFPTSGEYPTGPGGNVAQNYQHGVIRWGPDGTGITY